jgi:hypothetical protein
MGKISKGDKIHIEANYNFNKREGMKSVSTAVLSNFEQSLTSKIEIWLV